MNKRLLISAVFHENTADWLPKFLGLYRWSGGTVAGTITSVPSLIHRQSGMIFYNFPWRDLLQFYLKGTFRFTVSAENSAAFLAWIKENDIEGPFLNGELDAEIAALAEFDVVKK